MSGDCNIYGGFVVGSGGGSSSSETFWGNIKGEISNQSDLIVQLDNKIDKDDDKVLSSNDFTDEEQAKLSRLNTIFTFSLFPDKWELFNENIYYQTTILETIKSTDSVVADIVLSSDTELSEQEIELWSKVIKITINDGSVTTYFKGEIPNISLNIKIKI